MPFEIYELSNGISTLKVLTLIINLAIVLYLLISKRLFGIRGRGPADRAEREADAGWEAFERKTVVSPSSTQTVTPNRISWTAGESAIIHYGGIVAAPTTSLPESLGRVRNWDYRACQTRLLIS